MRLGLGTPRECNKMWASTAQRDDSNQLNVFFHKFITLRNKQWYSGGVDSESMSVPSDTVKPQ